MGLHLTKEEALHLGFIVDSFGENRIEQYKGTSKDIEIPESINGITIDTICDSAFADQGLTSVQFPDTIRVIEREAFKINLLTEVNLPSGLELVREGAFENNKIKRVIFNGNEAVEIYPRAFYDNMINTLAIPDCLVSAGAEVFGLNMLEVVSVSDLVIGTNMFSDNPRVKFYARGTGVQTGENNNYLAALYHKQNPHMKRMTLLSGNDTGEMPEDTEVIGSKAFEGANLKSITIPPSVATLESESFVNSGLKRIYIPSTVREISKFVFGMKTTKTPLVIVEEGSLAHEVALKMKWDFETIEPSIAEKQRKAKRAMIQGSDTDSIAKAMYGSIETDRYGRPNSLTGSNIFGKKE